MIYLPLSRILYIGTWCIRTEHKSPPAIHKSVIEIYCQCGCYFLIKADVIVAVETMCQRSQCVKGPEADVIILKSNFIFVGQCV